MWTSNIMPLREGLKTTLSFFGLTLLISIPVALIIAIMNQNFNKIAQLLLRMYIYLFRGTPLLLQMMFVFFGLPQIGIVLDRYTAALVTLILNYTAYYIEIFRGGLNTIPKGQFEAIKVLSIPSIKGYQKVILPQLWRIVLPSVGNEVINLVKDTSLIYVLGLGDLLKAGKALANQQASLIPYVYVGIIYLLLTGVVTMVLNRLERALME